MDDVLIGKANIIERCLVRIQEEYAGHEAELETNFTRQDAIVLNLQRACEAAIDAAMHLVRIHRLGVPTESRQAFEMLIQANHIPAELGHRLMSMIGFRNIVIHDYRALDLDILRTILDERRTDLAQWAQQLIRESGI